MAKERWRVKEVFQDRSYCKQGSKIVKRRFMHLALLMFLVLPTIYIPSAQAADLVDVTVRIKCVQQVENPDTASGDGDYFPEVKIGDHDFSIHPDSSGLLGPGPIEDDTFCPDWRFTRSVDRSGLIDITIRLWDDDGGLNFGGDLMDINPITHKVELYVRFNALTGSWAIPGSEVLGNVARGDGDHGVPEANDGRIAQIDFDVFVGTNSDIDGDGIPDSTENNGVRKSDGSLVADLKSLGADPCRKTIVVWIDYMTGASDGHSHEPKPAAIQSVVNAFDQAPVNAAACPYVGNHKSQGIDFIYLKGASIPEQAVMGLDDAYRAARVANFPPELRPYAHYAISAHDQAAGSSSSGLCCEDQSDDKDFLVTLGSWRSACVGPGTDGTLETVRQGDDVTVGMAIDVGPDRSCNTPANATDRQILAVGTGAADARVGTANDQAGTIMHELGHALGLGHGGDEKTNFMPNYLSNMNYSFQLGIPRGATPPGAAAPPTVLDYSRSVLPQLDKSKLKESAGIGTGLTDWTRWTDGGGNVRWGSAAGSIDWDWSRTFSNGSVDCGDGTSECVNININSDDDSGTPQTVLTGFDDWQNLKFRAVESPTAGGSNAAAHPAVDDLHFHEALTAEHQFLAFFDPDLATTKLADRSDVEAGNLLTYTVTVKNAGSGPAANVAVTDTFPAGQGKIPETRQLGTIDPGEQKVETFTLPVACETPDGTVLVNSATASSTDMGGGAEANLTNNSAAASTTVHAPKLQVMKTASGTGLAGEAITYKVSVNNTGSSAASNVVVKDVLPAWVYYSKALDFGAGPKPDSVTREADGTTTLVWNLDTLSASGSMALEYTVRPSLLFLGGETLDNAVEVSYRSANGCVFSPEHASVVSTVKIVEPSDNPLNDGVWRNHSQWWDSEILARIQATDQRFDSNNDGQLSSSEVEIVLDAKDDLNKELIAAYLNLATRKISAATSLDPKFQLISELGLKNVRNAVIYANQTLLLPVTNSNRDGYHDAMQVLHMINNGSKIE
jgi:uncharacterized repeat protein (TIGR01451 family)